MTTITIAIITISIICSVAITSIMAVMTINKISNIMMNKHYDRTGNYNTRWFKVERLTDLF